MEHDICLDSNDVSEILLKLRRMLKYLKKLKKKQKQNVTTFPICNMLVSKDMSPAFPLKHSKSIIGYSDFLITLSYFKIKLLRAKAHK